MILRSILDTDTYKLTMQECILFGKIAGLRLDSVNVSYEFINRGESLFPDDFADKLRMQVEKMALLRLNPDEKEFLSKNCPYLRKSFLDFLAGYHYDPTQVKISQSGPLLGVKVEGPWYRTVLYETPLLALISELYFQDQEPDESWRDRLKEKAEFIKQHQLPVADFGTRRRFSRRTHRSLVKYLVEHAGPTFIGTSNPWFAFRLGTKVVGTHAHEWFMAMAALFGYKKANQYALHAWSNEYGGDLGIALTDTFTTREFFKSFNMKFAKLFDGLRHDSGDPFCFVDRAIEHYNSLNIDPASKTIVFSDGLTLDRALEIANYCKGKIKYSFGIGTFLSNDMGVKPLNIVMKMTSCNGTPTVKLSDETGKNLGGPDEVKVCKQSLGIL